MKQTKIQHNKFIIKRGREIYQLLKNDLSSDAIIEKIKNKNNLNQKVNFFNSIYSEGGKFRFPYSTDTALTIINSCQYYTNFFELLSNTYFTGNLNIHFSTIDLRDKGIEFDCEDEAFIFFDLQDSKFVKSNLSQSEYFQTLEIAEWSYENIVISAIYFRVENLYNTYIERTKNSKNKLFHELSIFSSTIGLFFLNKIYGKQLFTTLRSTNLFQIYPEYWIPGFNSCLYNVTTESSYQNQDRLRFFNEITKRFPSNFCYIKFYLEAFDSFIPKSVRKSVYKYCYFAKSVHVLYYILRKYEVILNSTLTEEKKQYYDYYFTTHLKNELEYVLEKSSLLKIFNIFSKNKNFLLFVLFFISMTFTPTSMATITIAGINLGNFNSNKSTSSIGKKSASENFQIENSKNSKPKLSSFNEKKKKFATEQKSKKKDENYDKKWQDSFVARQKQQFTFIDTFSASTLATTNLIVHDGNNYTQIGRAGSYSQLNFDRTLADKYMDKKFTQIKKLCALDNDHLISIKLHRLVKYNRDKARCITTSRALNLSKEFAKKGLIMPGYIDSFRDTSVTEVTSLLIAQATEGMFERAEDSTNTALYSHVQMLENFGIYDILKESYAKNTVFAAKEMLLFIQQYQLPDNEKGVLATYHLNHMLNIASMLPNQVQELTDYSTVGQKFDIYYVIITSFTHLDSLTVGINEIMKYLELPESHPFIYSIFNKINCIYSKLQIECQACIAQYQIHMIQFNLPFQSDTFFTKLNTLISSRTPQQAIAKNSLKNIIDIQYDNDLMKFNIGNFVTKSKHPAFNFTGNDDYCFMQMIGPENDFYLPEEFGSTEPEVKIGDNDEQKDNLADRLKLFLENNEMPLLNQSTFDNEEILALTSAENNVEIQKVNSNTSSGVESWNDTDNSETGVIDSLLDSLLDEKLVSDSDNSKTGEIKSFELDSLHSSDAESASDAESVSGSVNSETGVLASLHASDAESISDSVNSEYQSNSERLEALRLQNEEFLKENQATEELEASIALETEKALEEKQAAEELEASIDRETEKALNQASNDSEYQSDLEQFVSNSDNSETGKVESPDPPDSDPELDPDADFRGLLL